MRMVEITCGWCGEVKERRKADVDRAKRQGRTEFYCSLTCGGYANGATTKNKLLMKTCPRCNDVFETTEGKNEATFCSRSCASAGSVTEARRAAGRVAAAGNFIHGVKAVANTLRSREAWKYVELKDLLEKKGEEHVFEYPLVNYIYDLALLSRKTLIEFDGPEHAYSFQREIDADKEKEAKAHGFNVRRIEVDSGIVIPAEMLHFL